MNESKAIKMSYSGLKKMIRHDKTLSKEEAVRFMTFKWAKDQCCKFVDGGKVLTCRPTNWKTETSFDLLMGEHVLSLKFARNHQGSLQPPHITITLTYYKEGTGRKTEASGVSRVVAVFLNKLPVKYYDDSTESCPPDYDYAQTFAIIYQKFATEFYHHIMQPLYLGEPIRDPPVTHRRVAVAAASFM